MTHTKILTSIKVKNKVKNIDLNIPKISYFIHKIYIQCARSFWKQPWLFHTGYNSLDLQRNIIEAEKVIVEAIKETIRILLPVKEVLKQYLGKNFIDKDFAKYEDEDITSVISEHTKDNIRQLLKHELGGNLKTLSENKDFSTISISEKQNTEPELSPERFDNREDDEISIDTATRIETTPIDTTTQIEDNDSISETQTQIEEMSVLNEVKSADTNMDNNFSFFDDAADF